jgi:hypothetical protein
MDGPRHPLPHDVEARRDLPHEFRDLTTGTLHFSLARVLWQDHSERLPELLRLCIHHNLLVPSEHTEELETAESNVGDQALRKLVCIVPAQLPPAVDTAVQLNVVTSFFAFTTNTALAQLDVVSLQKLGSNRHGFCPSLAREFKRLSHSPQ